MSLVVPSSPMWTDERVALVKRTIAKGADDDELALFLQVCERTGLDPFARQIHMVKRWDARSGREVAAIQVGIDGFRLVAQRSGQYAGQDPIEWCGPDGVWRDTWPDDGQPPQAARAGVYRQGFVRPLVRVALWSESVQSYKNRSGQWVPNPTWERMPALMLGKVAEAAALRAAFPAELSGLYTDDERGEAAATPAVGAPRSPAMPLDDEGMALLSEDNVAKFVAYCDRNGLRVAEVVRTGTDGRTDDVHKVRVREMTAVSDTAKNLVAAREPEPEVEAEIVEETPAPARGPDTYTEEIVEPTVLRPRMVSRNQVGKIKGEYGRLEIDDRKMQLAWTKDLLGFDDEPGSHNDLTSDEASLLIELLVAAESIEALDKLVPQEGSDAPA